MITAKEENKIIELVLSNPDKACAIVQCLLDNLQIVPVSLYAEIHKKKKRTVLHNINKLKKISIINRNFLTLNQWS